MNSAAGTVPAPHERASATTGSTSEMSGELHRREARIPEARAQHPRRQDARANNRLVMPHKLVPPGPLNAAGPGRRQSKPMTRDAAARSDQRTESAKEAPAAERGPGTQRRRGCETSSFRSENSARAVRANIGCRSVTETA